MELPDGAAAAMLDLAQDKLVILDETGTYEYANRAVERILGYDPQDLVGECVFEFIHPEDRDRVRAAFDEFVESPTGTAVSSEYRHRTADGDWVWLESRLSNRQDDDIDGYVVSSRDITERKRSERQRQETERRLQQISENAADALWMYSGDWEDLLFVNSAFEDVWGISVEEIRADPQRFLSAVHPDDVPAVEHAMARLADGETVDIEFRVNPDKEYRWWVWVEARPIVENGEVTRIVGFARDVTDRRRQDRQLEVIDRLLRHNLRNDMNVILGHAEAARETLEGTCRERMDRIVSKTSDLLATADKQREIVRLLNRGNAPESVDIADAVRGSISSIRKKYPAAEVRTDLPDTALASAVPTVGRAVAELLENAIEHSETGEPSVTVSVEATADAVEVVVVDGCPPIPDWEHQVLTGEHEGGDLLHSSGLGLWLVRWAVDLSDAALTFERRDGGNAVVLRFQRVSEDL
jgi:PAS domain S-box-containing protein